MRVFNTAGPCSPERHYMLSALDRLPEAPQLIESQSYFVVHAPRQTGKTTTLRALAETLTQTGRFAALYFSCEASEPIGDDYASVERIILNEILQRAPIALPEALRPPPWPETTAGSLLRSGLAAWAQQCPLPLVLLFDEIDAVRGESLRSVLRQLRAGFSDRPTAFPWSVVLCGLRDVRDYKSASGGNPGRLGTSSPFNIKVKSLKLQNFTPEELNALYAQHTHDTGQTFEESALDRAFELTRGQPWLVNALVREVLQEMGITQSPIAVSHLNEAKERLILARATHLDSLVARLHEPRVRRIIEPIIAGATLLGDTYEDDASYVRDVGLIAPNNPVRIANPIYQEVIVRVLASVGEANVTADPRSFVQADGRLDMEKILEEFILFWREHGDILTGGMSYHEVAPQLVLMAFFQRVVNGGGYVEREYGVGRGRIDVLIKWPFQQAEKRLWQHEGIEIKVWRDHKTDPLAQGLLQLEAYLDRLSLKQGSLVVFDRRSQAEPIDVRTRLERANTPDKGYPVRVLRA